MSVALSSKANRRQIARRGVPRLAAASRCQICQRLMLQAQRLEIHSLQRCCYNTARLTAHTSASIHEVTDPAVDGEGAAETTG